MKTDHLIITIYHYYFPKLVHFKLQLRFLDYRIFVVSFWSAFIFPVSKYCSNYDECNHSYNGDDYKDGFPGIRRIVGILARHTWWCWQTNETKHKLFTKNNVCKSRLLVTKTFVLSGCLYQWEYRDSSATRIFFKKNRMMQHRTQKLTTKF